MSLTLRLLLLVALAILPALLIEAYNEYSLRQDRAAEVRAQSVRLGEQTASEIRQIIEGIQRVAVTLAQVPVIVNAAKGTVAAEACSALLVKLKASYPGQLEMGVANRDASLVCTTRGITTTPRVRGAHFRRAIDTGGFVVGGYGESGTGDRYLTFAYPLRDEADQITGALLLGLDLRWLADHMAPRYAGVDAVVGLADRDLVYLMRLPDDETRLVGRAAPSGGAALAAMAGKGPIEAKGPDGVTRVAVIVPIAVSPDAEGRPELLVAFGLSKDAAFQAIDAGTRQAVILLAASLVLALLAAVVGGHYFVRRPVGRLLAAAERWREGDYRARVGAKEARGEFGQLGAAFDAMAERIDERAHALQSSEERFRSLASLVPAFVWFADPQGNIHYLNARWYTYTGQIPQEALSSGWSTAVHPGDSDRVLAAWREALTGGSLYEVEVRYRRHDGAHRWYLARAEPIRNEAGTITGWFGSSTDIDAIKRAERHRTLLINELNHRVKNTLATVQSIASQSLRSNDPAQGREAFEARLLALSRTHDVLTREAWSSASLREVIAEVIRPYQQDGESRFRIEGPALRVPPSMALPISMCLHELLTNAVKYGALSAEAGQVAVTWGLDGAEEGRRLRLRWEESGGPEVVEPLRKGFGSRLIERSLARELGGKVEMRFDRGGVTCDVDMPFPPANTGMAEPEVAA